MNYCRIAAFGLVIIFAFCQVGICEKNIESYPAPDEFVAIDKMPEIIHQEDPVYPEMARKKGIEGNVIIQALVDKKGEVVKVKIGKSSGHKLLDKAAAAAAKDIKYSPARQNKQPVAVWVSYKVSFRLDDKSEKEPEKFD
jgi:protein TonB